MVSMATHSGSDTEWCMPTKLLISQLILILDFYWLKTKLKLRHRPIIPLLHIFINIYENIKCDSRMGAYVQDQ